MLQIVLLLVQNFIQSSKKFPKHRTLAGSYSEGATLSQFIILTKKGKTFVKTVDRKGFYLIVLFYLIIY